MKTLSELLAPFKRDPTSNDAAAALVLGDDEAVRVLAAFRNVDHKWKLARKAPPDESASLTTKWQWLTHAWELDVSGVAEAAGVSEDVAEMKLDMLLRNRLIYPDGTIAIGASIALQMHTQTKLGIKPKLKQQQQQAKKDESNERPKE